MPHGYAIDEILDRVREHFRVPPTTSIDWVAGKTVDENTLMVLYRHRGSGLIVGVFVDAESTALTPESVIGDVILEIEEPAPLYVATGIDWAEELGVDSASVLWRGDLPIDGVALTAWVPPPERAPQDDVTYLASWNPPPFEYPANSSWFIGPAP